MTSLKNLLLQNYWANFNQTLHKVSLGEGDSSFFQMKGPALFPRGDNYEIVKIHWQNLKIFFCRTTEPILTKFGTKHPWVTGIQFCSNEGPRPFPRWDKYEIAKLHRQNLKIFFSRTIGLISTKLVTMHLWVMGIQVCSNEGPYPFSRAENYII